ncbi:MAG: rRNA maturation RNase YbeY [Clostridia bacterium]|nr:rRNA maturation RNase YbeY [Clostridia bacterium]
MKNTIYTKNDQKKLPLTPAARALVKRAINAALEYEKFDKPAEVSVTFVDNDAIKELNRDYRGKDAATDVLSFPISDIPAKEYEIEPDTGCVVLGDIVISVERAAAQAEEFGHSFERELSFLAVHSVLHLLGYDHERSAEDDAEQRRRQEEILAGIGQTRN